jgi:hybrid cluster-associated redox disulfide protein
MAAADGAAAARPARYASRGMPRAVPEEAITLDTPVEEVMRRFPATMSVFLRHRMHCIGCAVGPFHTVSDAIREYDLPAAALLRELREAAAAASGGE